VNQAKHGRPQALGEIHSEEESSIQPM